MKSKLLSSVLVSGLLIVGAGNLLANENGNLTKPSEKVQSLINKYQLKIVDYDYVKGKIGKGTINTSNIILIDARPNKKFKAGTIPTSINIPDTEYDKYKDQLKDISKDKELIVYCGGWNCGKSPKLANMLKKDGFKNVKLYQAGEPEWNKKDYLEVDIAVVKSAQEKNSALLVDARPYKKYLSETIPGAISIPDTELDKYIGRFPSNKEEKIIVFCGGYKCVKSHVVADKLISLGYKNVSVFAGGEPLWKEKGYGTTKSTSSVKKEETNTSNKFSKNGAKLGVDEGSIDGEWLYEFIKKGEVPEFIQIVDVTAPDEFKSGHIKGAINIHAEKLSAKELVAKLPKGKTIVFNCTAGGRSIDAWTKINNAKMDVSEIFYFDANIDCKGNDCKIEVNEPIG
jgi:rhodanese-related sulfurtransferase